MVGHFSARDSMKGTGTFERKVYVSSFLGAGGH